ncbi:CBN-IMP-2 protein [Caenorhabditis brenneri]|uniref:CBN-IMP-2 protein n=1 Tax=Caenorhabditis brenneri TaxID=135651 RepID=G0NRM9_CAEBE|nr:CBN-IMP-2 protein [Caenorhabditis brenneri]
MTEATTEVPPTATNATVFTFEEQATSSLALYGMSILCIIIGSYRSGQYIRKVISKKRLVEGSITMKEARKFPISASLVLFGLYLFFKPASERFLWVATVAKTLRVPDEYVQKINSTIITYTANSTVSSDPVEPLLTRLASKIPQEHVPDFIRAAALRAYDQLPTIGKSECMTLLTFLICFEGVSAFASLVKPFVTSFFKHAPLVPSFLKYNAPYLFSLKKGKKEMEEGDMEEAKNKDIEYIFKMDFDRHDLIAILMCSPILISHLYKRHWITNNIIGISFSILGIERLHLASFKAGSLLLCGLFLYDIFWVFGTDVMTSVAKGIDAPILLQFPQDIYRNGAWEASKHSMLGLGDIVIPGIFIALLHRFDNRVVQSTAESKTNQASLKGRYYFSVTVAAYMAGLFITMAVMHHFKAAQPALLYLVPCCLFVPLLLAVIRGELSDLWNYDEGKHVDNEENRKRVDSNKKNN